MLCNKYVMAMNVYMAWFMQSKNLTSITLSVLNISINAYNVLRVGEKVLRKVFIQQLFLACSVT